jgi:hypothetical protein
MQLVHKVYTHAVCWEQRETVRNEVHFLSVGHTCIFSALSFCKFSFLVCDLRFMETKIGMCVSDFATWGQNGAQSKVTVLGFLCLSIDTVSVN